jgi:hypothetical protein
LPVISPQSGDLLSLDFYDPLPLNRSFRYLLLGMDHFSKYAFARCTRRATAAIAVKFIKEIFNQVARFLNNLSDSATQFTA